MTKHPRPRAALLLVAVMALCLVGQSAAVSPARAADASAKTVVPDAEIRQTAAPAPEARRTATLTVETPLTAPAAEPAVPPSTRDGWSVLMTEGFEGTFPGPGWIAFDNDGTTNGEYFWDEDDYMFHAGTKSAWPAKGGANGLDPAAAFYANYMDSWMVYGPFDLTGYSAANLDFWYWNQSESNYDWFFWGHSADGADFSGTQVSGDSGGWQHVSLDLSAHLDDSSVWIAFVFQSDSTVADDGPFVDDITLNAYSGAVTREWTYMVYLDGDNNLEAAAVDDFLELSSVGSTSQVAVVAQMDRIGGYDTTYDDWTDTRRFYITSGMTPAAANGTSIGEVNMGAQATLVAFVQWATANYPANHYALILWDHGSGWRSRALDNPVTQGIAYDDSSGGDGLSMTELRSALSTLTAAGANPFDLIGMDACLMALIEVDDQLRPYADVRVTSQEAEPNDGAPQDAILAALVGNPTMTAPALGTVYVDEYYASYGNDETQSAADLGADYAALRTAVDGFAAALLANGAANAAGIQAARSAVQEFDFDYYIDLYDFASKVSANVTNTAIDNAAAAAMAALGPATVHEHHGAAWPGAHGISIYFPKTLGEYDTRYDGSSGFLQFTAATQWDEWLRAYYGYGSGPGSNDDFDSPLLVGSAPYTNTQDVSLATTAGDDPAFPCSSDNPRYRTVWYRYTSSAPQTLTIDTFGSDFDTVLAVWTGNRGSLTNVACNDDSGDLQSRVEFDAPVGTTFHIEIASYGSAPAGSQLTLNLAAAAVSLPGAFGKTSPASGAVDLEQPVTLSWGASAGATSYEYCHDATNDGACTEWVNTGTSTSPTVSPTPGISYWQVRARNAAGLTYADGAAAAYWSFEASSVGFWAMLAPMSAARPGAAVAAVGGKVYTIGGFDGLSVVKAYDPATNTWAARSAKPTGVSDAGAAVIDGIIYVAGGNNGTTQVAALEAYNPATNTWTAKAPLPAALQGAAVVAVGSKLYVIGGYAGSSYLTTCYAYDQPGNTWTTCSSLPGAPAYAAAGAIDGKIYIWGGQLRDLPYSFESTSPYTGFIQRYDPATNTWATVVNFYSSGQELAYGAATVHDGRLYRCGGQTHTATSIPGSVPPLWAHQYYTTSTCSTYEPGVGIDYGSFPHMQEARRRHGLVEIGGRLYAVGGYAASIESALLSGEPTIVEASFRSVAAQDGWVRERDETSARGGTVNSGNTTSRLGDDDSDRQYRSILAFDTSTLPDNAVITSATIRIRRSGVTGTNPISSHGLLKIDMQAGYYHDSPLLERFDFHAVGSRGNVGRFIKTADDRWYRAPLRAPAWPLINRTGHTQFRLRFEIDDNDDTAADILNIYSGNYPTVGDRPELIITYYVP